MKASIAALLIGFAYVGHACGQQAMPKVPPQPGGARFYNPGAQADPPTVSGFYADVSASSAPQAAQPIPNPTIPTTPVLPGGARPFNPTANVNSPTASGAYFHDVNAQAPLSSGPRTAQDLPLSTANPTLPFPQSAPGENFVLPAPPLPPMTTPVIVNDALPPLPDYATTEPFMPLNAGGPYPAVGAWGPGIASNDRGPALWFSADYLFFWLKNGPMPQPLVVTGSAADEFPGALDQPGTVVLYGGKDINYNPFSGARLNAGLWCGPDHRFGFEMGGFILEQKSTHFAASGGATGNPYLARPFINARTGFENVYFVSQNFNDPVRSARMTGDIQIANTSRMWSWETNALWNMWRGTSATANLIGGFRSVGLRERLSMVETLRNIQEGGGVFFGGASVDPGNTVTTFDKYSAENTFYGAQLGARFLIQEGRFSLNVTGKAAMGVVQQLMVVDGGTIVRNQVKQLDGRGLVIGAAPGGVLTQSSNIGRHFQNKFAVVPEVAADLCFDITDRLVIKLGYTFVYLSSVARPGDQIDRTINPGLVPTDFDYGTGGPARPAHPYKSTSIWTQGVNVGLEFRY